MSKPKEAVKEIIQHSDITLFINDAAKWVDDIMSIEGVRHIFVNSKVEIAIFVDPRYDTTEVAKEVKDLITQEVLLIFQNTVLLGD